MSGNTETAIGLVHATPPKRVLIEKIERLNISADAKAILGDIASLSLEIGGRLVQVGRRIIGFVLDLVREYPKTAFGVLAAMVVSGVIASVPFIGGLLAPLLTPLLVAFGLTKGALADLADASLHTRIRQLETELSNATARG